MFFLSPFSSFT